MPLVDVGENCPPLPALFMQIAHFCFQVYCAILLQLLEKTVGDATIIHHIIDMI